MSALGPGDWVEALRYQSPEPDMIEVIQGGLYCVSDLDDKPTAPCPTCLDPAPGIYLVGDRKNPTWSRCSCAFRPVYRPRADLIEALLQPVDGVSPELETA